MRTLERAAWFVAGMVAAYALLLGMLILGAAGGSLTIGGG